MQPKNGLANCSRKRWMGKQKTTKSSEWSDRI